ncbi:MAG: hypothetical protein Kow00109_20950 [Acidobacteriota bacterium]
MLRRYTPRKERKTQARISSIGRGLNPRIPRARAARENRAVNRGDSGGAGANNVSA